MDKTTLCLVLLEDSKIFISIRVGTETYSDQVELDNKSVSDFICRTLNLGLSVEGIQKPLLCYNKLFDSVNYLTIKDRYLGVINLILEDKEFLKSYDVKYLILREGIQKVVDVIIHRLNLIRSVLRKHQAMTNKLILMGGGECE